ncbi:hypothetical protein I3760_Q017900 [Carya illinoinensis]|nr:hypothetical protein I3760_Q017900 [Carya illinoinensis]
MVQRCQGFRVHHADDGGEDLFVHQSAIKCEGFRSLAEGERVEFQIELGVNERTKAVNVTGPTDLPSRATRRTVTYGPDAEVVEVGEAAVVTIVAILGTWPGIVTKGTAAAAAAAAVSIVVRLGTWLGTVLTETMAAAAVVVAAVVARVIPVVGFGHLARDAGWR